MTSERNELLRACQRCLNTPDGEILVNEFVDAYDPSVISVGDAAQMAEAIALRNAARFMTQLQEGVFIDDQ